MFHINEQNCYQNISSLADVRFHMVALHVRAVSVFGKNLMWFAVFWHISLRFSDPPYAPLTELGFLAAHLKD